MNQKYKLELIKVSPSAFLYRHSSTRRKASRTPATTRPTTTPTRTDVEDPGATTGETGEGTAQHHQTLRWKINKVIKFLYVSETGETGERTGQTQRLYGFTV